MLLLLLLLFLSLSLPCMLDMAEGRMHVRITVPCLGRLNRVLCCSALGSSCPWRMLEKRQSFSQRQLVCAVTEQQPQALHPPHKRLRSGLGAGARQGAPGGTAGGAAAALAGEVQPPADRHPGHQAAEGARLPHAPSGPAEHQWEWQCGGDPVCLKLSCYPAATSAAHMSCETLRQASSLPWLLASPQQGAISCQNCSLQHSAHLHAGSRSGAGGAGAADGAVGQGVCRLAAAARARDRHAAARGRAPAGAGGPARSESAGLSANAIDRVGCWWDIKHSLHWKVHLSPRLCAG